MPDFRLMIRIEPRPPNCSPRNKVFLEARCVEFKRSSPVWQAHIPGSTTKRTRFPIGTSCTIEIALTFSFSATGRMRWPPHSGFKDSKTGQRHWTVKCHPALTIGYKAAERERSVERRSQPRGKTGVPWDQPRKGNGYRENG